MKTAFITGATGFLGGRLMSALLESGWRVRALHRSTRDADKLKALGAEPVLGTLDEAYELQAAIGDVQTVFHCAALFKMWAPATDFERVNVEGTRNMLAAAASQGVKRFVHIGAAGIMMGRGKPMTAVTEDTPFAYPRFAPYLASKARAEDLVLEADDPAGMRTMAILPPMIWGAGMPMLDHTIANVKAGRFAWPGGGASRMSTAHFKNVCHAAILAAESSLGGRAYFVSDGRDRTLKEVIGTLLDTRGVVAGDRSAPLGMAWLMAAVMESAWKVLGIRGEPPLTRQMLRLIGWDFTVSDRRAHDELNYSPVISWEEGLAQMRPGR
jgi:nucleoside-diphosphate-sugar epimerase